MEPVAFLEPGCSAEPSGSIKEERSIRPWQEKGGKSDRICGAGVEINDISSEAGRRSGKKKDTFIALYSLGEDLLISMNPAVRALTGKEKG